MKRYSHGCTLDCFDACKFNVYAKDNKVIKIEGDKEHPYTKGFICKKGLAHLDRLYHNNRIYKPLLKQNGQWIEISFKEALEIMTEKLKYYKENYCSKSILYYEQYGNGALLKSIGEIFMNFYGGASKQKGGPCWSAGIAAQKLDFGDSRSHSLEDMLNSKNIFVWGKNPAYTTIHTMQVIRKAKANGSKVVVIDPIFTETAKIADKYIQVKAGGDLALALAIGKIIVEEELYDKEYINSYVLGFNKYKEYIKELDINVLCNKSGVKEEVVRELADLYCTKYSTILLGYGLQKYKNGGNTIRAIDTLAAITGQIGFSGGGVNYANKVYPGVLNTDPYNSEKCADNRFFYVSELSDFINESINGEISIKDKIFIPKRKNVDKLIKENIPIKMAIITKSNLLNQLPNINKLKEEFKKVEFKVCFDMFMTDTATECDLFIPVTSTLESEDLIFSSMTNPYITYNEQVVEPQDELMDEYYFFQALAEKLKISNYPMVEKKEYLSKVIEPLNEYFNNITLDMIKKNYLTIHKDIAWEGQNFATKSGKFEICIYEEESMCDKKRAFRLLTNHSRESISSQHYMDNEEIVKAYINSKMADALKLEDKSIMKLVSDAGVLEVKVIINDIVSDYVVMMYVGWWNKNGNPNMLTINGISDIGGQVTYNETFVDIIK